MRGLPQTQGTSLRNSAVTRITLRYVSPCIRLELRRCLNQLLRRSNAIAEQLAHQPLSRPRRSKAKTQWPSGGKSLGESSRSQARS